VRIVHTIAELRAALAPHPQVTLVPTMGNLHDGHLSLVQIARRRPGVVVTSIFVNALQFAPHEDYRRYPRTLERDCELLSAAGCDVVFAPADAEIYPEEQQYTVAPPAALGEILEGSVRPGFFTGVCTVVLKLFNIVRPQAAVFGKKDYQQLLIIQRMVRQLALPIEIVAADTVRSDSGLALSSRNGYLTAPQLQEAAELHAVLRRLAEAVRAGRSDWPQLELEAAASLAARGWRPDYVSIRRLADLGAPVPGTELIAVAAARLGDTRLLDNTEIGAAT